MLRSGIRPGDLNGIHYLAVLYSIMVDTKTIGALATLNPPAVD